MRARLVLLGFCALPVLAGLWGIAFPAMGWFPPLGREGFSLAPLQGFLAQPGLWDSLWLSLMTALLSTFLAYWLAMLLLAFLHHEGRGGWVFRLISPLLSVPHITVAVGFLFLLQPSGWLLRLLSPWLTGWVRPPDFHLVPDLYGMALVIGLLAKELPFLLLMGLAALSQIPVRAHLDRAAGLGYGALAGWFYVIQPQLSERLRMPVLIVLVFAVSVVDMAVVLAPSTPPPLAVRILEWYRDSDLDFQFIAAVGAVVQLGLAGLAGGIWFVGGALMLRGVKALSARGWRFRVNVWVARLGRRFLLVLGVLPCLLSLAGGVAICIWSVADVWRFPSALPQDWGLRAWSVGGAGLHIPTFNSLYLGLSASALSVVLAILWLENQPKQAARRWESIIYVPLLLPQASFLFGLQILLIFLGLDGAFLTLLWAHSLFVFPYVMLSLGASWRRFDRRYSDVAMALGKGAMARFFHIKLPMLMVPILTAFAVGFAVSIALYLPTIFASNGRFITLTTESVVLASSASRQALGVASVMQMALPLLVFLGCDLYMRWRGRRFDYFRHG